MNQTTCRHLGTLTATDQPSEAIDYPSFENQCFATEQDTPLLLTHQATFCLSANHRHCPRFLAVQTNRRQPSLPNQPNLAGWLNSFEDDTRQFGGLQGDLEEGLAIPSASLHEDEAFAPQASRRRWAWVGAAMIFITVVLCGSIFAVYTGWQLVNANYLAKRTSQAQLLNRTVTTPAVLLIVTATSAQKPLAPSEAPAASVPTATTAPPTAVLVNGFPQAVTPTPVVINPSSNQAVQSNSQPVQVVAIHQAPVVGQALSNTQSAPQTEPLPNITLPTPALDLQVEIPTRRPTPILDLPTSTPAAVEPTATPTPPPPLGTPVVIFAPLQTSLTTGSCTLVRWHVENVQAVYYENQGVNGDGEREECIEDESEVVTLAVILPNGSTKIYTTTLTYLPPTPTLTPTPSFTPEEEFEPSPTWTPDAPTATPTIFVHYGTSLEIFGENRHQCTPDSTCEYDLLVANVANAPDNLVLTFVQSGPWPTLLCEDNGNCSTSNLTLNNLDSGSSRLIKLKVNVASDATPQIATYSLQSISGGSGGSATSSVVTVEVEVP
jgi:hypothetical protein